MVKVGAILNHGLLHLFRLQHGSLQPLALLLNLALLFGLAAELLHDGEVRIVPIGRSGPDLAGHDDPPSERNVPERSAN